MWYAYCVSGLFCLELSRAIKLSEDRPPFWAYDVTSVERVSLTRGSVYFDYTVLLFGILSRFGNSLYSAMLFFFWLILCNLGSLRDVCDYCSFHNSHNCHIKMMKKREWPVRHHDTIISKKNFFDHFWISAKDVRDITRAVHMMHDATPPRCVITNEIQSHDSNRDLKALCRKNFSWR